MSAVLQQKVVHIPDIGFVSITKRKRCRRLSIRVNAKDVKVSIPFRSSFNEGESFLLEKLNWIKETSQRLSENIPSPHFFDESTLLFTQVGLIKIVRGGTNKIHCVKVGHEAYIYVPEGLDILGNVAQEQIKTLIFKYLRVEAKDILPQRVAFYANKLGLEFRNVKINNASTRWGSCSYNNNINLNLRLLLLPDKLSDYIILHELAHILHKNHGPKFWDFLERIAGDAKFKAKELKKFKIKGLL